MVLEFSRQIGSKRKISTYKKEKKMGNFRRKQSLLSPNPFGTLINYLRGNLYIYTGEQIKNSCKMN